MGLSQVLSIVDYRLGVEHSEGVWLIRLPVREMVLLSDRYDMSISLLILDAPGVEHPDEPNEDMTTNLPSFQLPLPAAKRRVVRALRLPS